MTPEQQTVSDIRAMISALGPHEEACIEHCSEALRALLKLSPHMRMAFALVGAEMAVEAVS